MRERISVMEIPFDPVTQDEVLNIFRETIEKWHQGQKFIATPNPEMLLETLHNDVFKDILKKTHLNIPDGIGILWASAYEQKIDPGWKRWKKIMTAIQSLFLVAFSPKKIRGVLPERVTGTDIMDAFCSNPAKGAKIFLLGGGPGIADSVVEKYDKTHFAGTYEGSPAQEEEADIVHRINQSGANILFVAFGAPKQEIWLSRNLHHLHHIKIAMGVGGAFDFLAGYKKRAPAWMRKLGIEWLFRLFLEPSRIHRIWNATVKFPLMIIRRHVRK